MSAYTFGFIGTGNMGGALAKAARRTLSADQMLLTDAFTAKAEALAAELGCATGTTHEVASRCKYIFLGVKPQMMADLLTDIGPILAHRQDDFVLVSMAAGLTTVRIAEMAGGSYPVIRIMPNTPCAVGAGVILYDANKLVSDDALQAFVTNMSGAGLLDRLEEHLIDAGTSVSGCAPAYVCQFIEALADGGVVVGLPRAKAQLYAAQTLIGTAQLMLQTGQHPGQLKDAVCSPGGATIAGVRVLEQQGLRAAATDAVVAGYEKAKSLGK